MTKSSKHTSDLMLKFAVMAAKNKFPELFHACPIGPVSINRTGLIPSSTILSIVSNGHYKLKVNVKLKTGENIFVVHAGGEFF